MEVKAHSTNSVRAGYKQTEVGVIPEDWETLTIGEFCSATAGKDLVKEDFSLVEDSRFKYQIFSNAHTNAGHYGFSKSCQFPENSVTITARGGIGHAEYRSAPFCAIGRLLVLRPEIDCDMRFVNEFIRNYIRFSVESTGVPQLTAPQVKKYSIALPPTKAEQEAIAEALSDADAWIESLDQLIQKKRRIKEGTMQELLTGKRRLPGFEGEWKEKRLGEIFKVCHGRSQHSVACESGDYPILATGGQIGRANKYLYNKPSLLIGRKGTIDKPQFIESPFWSVDTLFYTEIFDPNVPKFIFYKACLIPWRSLNEASGVPSLNAKTIEAIDVVIPLPKEQTAIAEVLSDMDAEVEALETKLSKARQIKKGMMQELLTGKTRLV